jgi:hypothetical protein
MMPFTQDRIVIGAAPGLSVAPPDVQIFPPNPGATTAIVWAIASAPGNVPVSGIGTFLVSVAYPDPLIVLLGNYAVSDVLSAGFVPNHCALVGVPVYTQGLAFEGSGTAVLTNALDYVLGLL